MNSNGFFRAVSVLRFVMAHDNTALAVRHDTTPNSSSVLGATVVTAEGQHIVRDDQRYLNVREAKPLRDSTYHDFIRTTCW